MAPGKAGKIDAEASAEDPASHRAREAASGPSVTESFPGNVLREVLGTARTPTVLDIQSTAWWCSRRTVVVFSGTKRQPLGCPGLGSPEAHARLGYPSHLCLRVDPLQHRRAVALLRFIPMALIEADEPGHGEEADHSVRTRRRVHPHGEAPRRSWCPRRWDAGCTMTAVRYRGSPPSPMTRPMPTASPAASAHTEKNECCHAIVIASRRRERKPTAA
jgi:hypothetical protein